VRSPTRDRRKVDAARHELAQAIIDAGVDDEDAWYAVSQHRITRWPIAQCVAEQQTEEARTAITTRSPPKSTPVSSDHRAIPPRFRAGNDFAGNAHTASSPQLRSPQPGTP
jgi:hypothetical protein